jgi:hypothetical protein
MRSQSKLWGQQSVEYFHIFTEKGGAGSRQAPYVIRERTSVSCGSVRWPHPRTGEWIVRGSWRSISLDLLRGSLMSLLGSKISLDAKRIWQPELRILEVERKGKTRGDLALVLRYSCHRGGYCLLNPRCMTTRSVIDEGFGGVLAPANGWFDFRRQTWMGSAP